jgi:pilus assembly protein Flp/PilA
MTRILKALAGCRKAATTVEYGMILMTLVIAVIGAISGVADETNGLWATVSSKSSAAVAAN